MVNLKQNIMNRLAEIIETYINGNITVAKNEFRYWRIDLIQVVQCSELFGIRQTIKILKAIGFKVSFSKEIS